MSKLLSVIFLLCVLTFSNCLSNLLRKGENESENENESYNESEAESSTEGCAYYYQHVSKCPNGEYRCCNDSKKCRRGSRYGVYFNFCA